MLKLLLDADPIVYRSGFAAQHTRVEAIYETAESDPVKIIFDSVKDFNTWRDAQPADVSVLREDRITTAEPVENALTIVRSTVGAIHNDVREFFMTDPRMHAALSGPGNYREAIGKVKQYKGNRTRALPVHYQAIRNYLTGNLGAKVVHGREADDEISILAHRTIADGEPNGYVIATIDKDLDQVPGWHYDYRLHTFYNVDAEDARDAFWRQVLSGDVSDNVPGAWKIGKETAKAIVEKWSRNGMTDEQRWQDVVCIYGVSQQHEDCPYKDRTAESVALETAQLVYIQKEPRELWQPPGVDRVLQTAGDIDD